MTACIKDLKYFRFNEYSSTRSGTRTSTRVDNHSLALAAAIFTGQSGFWRSYRLKCGERAGQGTRIYSGIRSDTD